MEEEVGRGQGGAGEAQVKSVYVYVLCKQTEEMVPFSKM